MKHLIIAIALSIVLVSWPAMANEVRIFTEDTPNSHFKDKDGKVTGYVYELVLEMQKRMGDTTPIEMVPWARGYNLTLEKPNHILFSTTFTEERRDLFKWVGPMFETTWLLFAKKGSGIKLSSLEDAKAIKSIGTYRDDVREAHLKQNGFTNLDSITEDSLNLKKLMAGRITLWAASSDIAPLTVEKMGLPADSIELVLEFGATGLFIAFNKNTSDEIVLKWNKAYQEVKADGTMKAIYDKWGVSVPTYQIPSK